MKAPFPTLLLTLVATAAFSCGSGDAEPSSGANRALFDAPESEGSKPIYTVWDLDIPADAPRVVFLGDSISAGLHLAEHEAYPALLQVRLALDGVPFELVNASESGRTTAGGLTALPWVLQRKPDLVVLELGGNDGLRGVELDVVETNLRKLIDMVREAEADILLLGMRLPPNYGEYGETFDALYPRLAEELDVPFLPYFMRDVGGVPEMTLRDGLHPNAAGQELLADNVEPALRQAIARLEAAQSDE